MQCRHKNNTQIYCTPHTHTNNQHHKPDHNPNCVCPLPFSLPHKIRFLTRFFFAGENFDSRLFLHTNFSFLLFFFSLSSILVLFALLFTYGACLHHYTVFTKKNIGFFPRFCFSSVWICSLFFFQPYSLNCYFLFLFCFSVVIWTRPRFCGTFFWVSFVFVSPGDNYVA